MPSETWKSDVAHGCTKLGTQDYGHNEALSFSRDIDRAIQEQVY